eukprot:TRINITY_DN7912_c0_g1_i1.p1 TRINITY_DN7912_c0_g1~~TRINITY_DN7912_c0_g1_i1.p1  ORF type:complete len:405 (+),score=83.61 TRINITY_DN7912_c0_g1_i1:175-1389(+)
MSGSPIRFFGAPPCSWKFVAVLSALFNLLLLSMLAISIQRFDSRALLAGVVPSRSGEHSGRPEHILAKAVTDVAPSAHLVSAVPEPVSGAVSAMGPARADAAIVYFGGSSDTEPLQNLLVSLRLLDVMFNDRYRYPVYVFHLDSDPVNKTISLARQVSRSKLTFVALPSAVPEHISPERLASIPLHDKNHRLPYKHMCQFFAGTIFRHPVLLPYRYLWRLDADSSLLQPLPYDVFAYVAERNISFAYVENQLQTATPPEFGLWDAFFEYRRQRNVKLRWTKMDGWEFGAKLRSGRPGMKGLFNTHSVVMDAHWFRTAGHLDWFDHLDLLGGIYYERWADHQILTLSLMMFANASAVHRFRDWSYRHAHIQLYNSFLQLPEAGHTELAAGTRQPVFRLNDGRYTR